MLRVLVVFLCLILISCSREKEGCEDVVLTDEMIMEATTGYDSVAAEELGADDFGMHQYVMALLKAGPNRDYSDKTRDSLQTAHMANIDRLAEEGVLVLAGPTMDEGDLKGIYIFDVRTIEEAHELTSTDPAIQYGSLVMELHPWYGSAAVMGINKVHKKISKKNF